jgi:signal transduction histidine kinase
VLAGAELVLLASAGGQSHQIDRHAADALGYALVALTGLTVVAARRWPVPSFGVALTSILAYAGLGYPTDGPIFLVVPVTLYFTIRAGELWRSIGFGALATVALFVVYGAFGSYGVFGSDRPSTVQLLFVPVVITGIVAVAYLASYRSRQVEQLRQAEASRLVAEDRLRIARELHDVVSHSISVINVQAGVAAHVIDRQPEQAKQALLTIRDTSKEALQELRSILGVLRGVDETHPRAPAPGLDRLNGLLDATDRTDLAATLVISGERRRLPPTVDLTAYRIVEESLSNALRYAGPAAARVEIVYGDQDVTVEVTDNGRGAPGPSAGSGLGIRGMRERASSVGGTLEAGPLPSGGFRVFARLPTAGTP